ncbi:MAG TPA: DUF86 domain-containing protein [Thermoanaerobaculia bacterium]|jgi:uncharacterized protein YutE (UPF0331/DUF86 family)|nr:DUF86 domain-containing protein [Thermoanaerobaculia bacterium]
MTDFELVRKKLALIETSIREIQEMVRPAEIQTDLFQQRFAERTLLIAIQSSLDAAAHIVADDRLGEPRNNRELFEILGRNGWIPEELVDALRRMVGFRNILVHGYEIVDPAVVEHVVRRRLGDLLTYVAALRERLSDG